MTAFPLPDPAFGPTRPFFEAAALGELRIPRCEACHRFAWYPPERCPACAGSLAWEATSGRGTVYSFAVVRRPLGYPAVADSKIVVPFFTPAA